MGDLKEQLENWDGKSVPYLQELYLEHSAQPDFLDRVTEFMRDSDLQNAASWLVKHAVENQRSLSENQILTLYEMSGKLESWPSQLHLLQLMPHLTIPDALKFQIFRFSQRATESDNKFVRAWGYNGLYEVADLYPEFRQGLNVVFDAAIESEPASVKARLRTVLKQVHKNW